MMLGCGKCGDLNSPNREYCINCKSRLVVDSPRPKPFKMKLAKKVRTINQAGTKKRKNEAIRFASSEPADLERLLKDYCEGR